jgi:hypothetical protein
MIRFLTNQLQSENFLIQLRTSITEPNEIRVLERLKVAPSALTIVPKWLNFIFFDLNSNFMNKEEILLH